MVDVTPIAGPSKPSRQAAAKQRKAARVEAKAAAVAAAATAEPKEPKPERKAPKPTVKGKEKASAKPVHRPASVYEPSRPGAEAWPYVQLASSQLAAPPVLYNKEGSICFVPDFAAVKVYRSSTAQLLSTLSPSDGAHTGQVTALLLNPANMLQLHVASDDGVIRTWDYIEGKQIRTLELPEPVVAMCAHAATPDVLYIASKRVKPKKSIPKDGTDPFTVWYPVQKVTVKRGGTVVEGQPHMIGKLRDVVSLQTTHDGAYLIVACYTGGCYLAATAHLTAGFASLEPTHVFTSLAVHPSELSFATGDTKGKIHVWYPFDQGWWSEFVKARKEKRPNLDRVLAPPSRMFHWHAHAVTALSYTPNGAYLASGGEEAVLVLWQIATGHKEFVPRLGAPIANATVSGSGDEIAVMLADATVLLVNAQELKVTRSIAGIKIDATGQEADEDAPLPLAAQPSSDTLVLPSSHPSSIQFYSPSATSHLLELEVSPSNRFSRTAETPIEPARVERVAFSQSHDGIAWLATLDAWRTEIFAEESYLKLWRQRASVQAGYDLDTRIDRPHGGHRVTGMAFAPAQGARPLLATCGLDGQTRIWACPTGESSWRCRSSFGYRDGTPSDLAWSGDGSLLAVVYPRVVVLWSIPSCDLVGTFASPAVSPFTRVAFAGLHGSTLVAGGATGVVAWDVVKGGELLQLGCLHSHLLATPGSDKVIVLETLPASRERPVTVTTALVIDLVTRLVTAKDLPSPVRQAALVSTTPTAANAAGLAIVVITLDGSIGLAGDAVRPPPSAPALPIDNSEIGARTLFDDLFGMSALRALPYEARRPAIVGSERVAERGLPEVLQAPSHVIPPLRTVWRDLLPLPPKRTTRDEEAAVAQDGMEVDEPAAMTTEVAQDVELPVYEVPDLDELFAGLRT